MGWYISSFIGIFFSNATYWYVVNKKLNLQPIYKFKKKTLRKALSISIPTIPHYYTSYLLDGSGRMVLDQSNVAQGEIGRLSISQQLGSLFQTGMRGINNAVSPYLMQALKNRNQKIIKKICLLFVTVVFGLAFILSLWSKEIFNILLSNDSLKSSYPFFIIYIMALCYRPMYLVVSNYYFYFEKTKQLLVITIMSGCIAFITYLLFIPHYGVWAFLIGHYIACLYYGYSGYFYSSYINNTSIRIPVIRIMLIQLVLTVSAFIFVDYLALKTVLTALLSIFILVQIYKNRHVIKK